MIIVFGSNVLDLFFQTPDLPPHDTALHLESHVEQPGGKGANQAIAAARAGSEVRFFGALGDGGHGRQMYKNLATNGVDVSGIQMLEGVPSGLAAIFVDERDGTHKVVVSQGANLHARQSSVPDKLLTPGTTLLLQGELPMKETEDLIARAHAKNCRTVINLAPASPISQEALKNLDVIILNEHEADALGQSLGIETADKASFAADLCARFNLTTIVTLGPEGSVCCGPDGLMTVSCLPIKPVDTIGAGDAFSGYLAAMLDQGKSMADALRYAAVAGSLTCTKVGAQSALPHVGEVEKELSKIHVSGASANPAATVMSYQAR